MRLLRGYTNSEFDNVALWHERDISHSSVECIVLLDLTTLRHYVPAASSFHSRAEQ